MNGGIEIQGKGKENVGDENKVREGQRRKCIKKCEPAEVSGNGMEITGGQSSDKSESVVGRR